MCLSPVELFLYYAVPTLASPPCLIELGDRSLNGIFGITATRYFEAFALTCILESVIYYAILPRMGVQRFTAVVITVNLATHPLVCLGFPQFFAFASYARATSLLASEVFAFGAESIMLTLAFIVPWRKAISSAFLANVFSWWVGSIIFKYVLA